MAKVLLRAAPRPQRTARCRTYTGLPKSSVLPPQAPSQLMNTQSRNFTRGKTTGVRLGDLNLPSRLLLQKQYSQKHYWCFLPPSMLPFCYCQSPRAVPFIWGKTRYLLQAPALKRQLCELATEKAGSYLRRVTYLCQDPQPYLHHQLFSPLAKATQF